MNIKKRLSKKASLCIAFYMAATQVLLPFASLFGGKEMSVANAAPLPPTTVSQINVSPLLSNPLGPQNTAAIAHHKIETRKPVAQIQLNEKRREELYQHILKYEGLELSTYHCPAGQLTIGVGHTKTVYPGMVITERQARKLFDKDVEGIEKRIKSFGLKKPMTDYEYMALVAFAFNTGVEVLNPRASTVGRLLHAGRYDDMREEMKKWHKAEDPRTGQMVSLPRLKQRRDEEYWMAKNLPLDELFSGAAQAFSKKIVPESRLQKFMKIVAPETLQS